MKRLEWFIARRYLASRKKGRFLSLITLIAVGGIFVGVMALITVNAVMTGLQRDLQGKIVGINPHIFVFQSGARGFRMANWQMVVDSVNRVPGVVTAQPYVMSQVGVVAHGSIGAFGTLYGMMNDLSKPPLNNIERDLRDGTLKLGPTKSGKPGLVLGHRLASQLTATYGDIVKVVVVENIKTDPFGNINPTIADFEITGIFNTGMFEYDNGFMYAELAPVQDMLSLPPDIVSGVAVNIEDPWDATAVRNLIDARIGFEYYTYDWRSMNQALFSALKLEKLAMAVILFLIVLVAAFNIVGTLVMVVADKTREIGILKAMGLSDAKVLRIFIYQGLAIGVIGTILGTIGGVILVGVLKRYELVQLPGEVYFIDRLPAALEAGDLLGIVAASLLITCLATIYPARQASRLLPVEAIRHE